MRNHHRSGEGARVPSQTRDAYASKQTPRKPVLPSAFRARAATQCGSAARARNSKSTGITSCRERNKLFKINELVCKPGHGSWPRAEASADSERFLGHRQVGPRQEVRARRAQVPSSSGSISTQARLAQDSRPFSASCKPFAPSSKLQRNGSSLTMWRRNNSHWRLKAFS